MLPRRRLHQWLFRGHCLQPLRRMIAWLRIYPPRPYLMPRVCLVACLQAWLHRKRRYLMPRVRWGNRLQKWIRIQQTRPPCQYLMRTSLNRPRTKMRRRQWPMSPWISVSLRRRIMISKRRIKHQQRRHQCRGILPTPRTTLHLRRRPQRQRRHS